ncbi:Rrf2 family transcriptional regulator [Rhizobium sp. WL3]|uniref:Rrf2 family transcriptional regulator n=1 Tax=Rhizobium sp. WL3 TaxID=2603277 RepID=UPI0011C1EAA7|nr:Rrf2 family transcriptional regulator [Rhizobium sp. WL3]QEE44455.1 Rrf2 family transcriptional regulator [Rhizobium sp. WL3]
MADSRLSRMLHVLVHMHLLGDTETSETIALMLNTNPVVVRRTMAELKAHGIVSSTGGRNGGWTLARPADAISVRDVYRALVEGLPFSIALSSDHPNCPVERSVNALLVGSMTKAELTLSEDFAAVSIADLARMVRPS